jgi:hypothetical protein
MSFPVEAAAISGAHADRCAGSKGNTLDRSVSEVADRPRSAGWLLCPWDGGPRPAGACGKGRSR